MSENLTQAEREMRQNFATEAMQRGYGARDAAQEADRRLAEWRAENDPRTVALIAEGRERQTREAAELAAAQEATKQAIDAHNAQALAEQAEREARYAQAERLGLRILRRTSL